MEKLKLTKTYEKYPEYKDSGVAWVGEIPNDWGVFRGKNLFKKMNRAPLVSDEIVTAFRDGTVTLRKNRREDGFTMADKEIGYQRIQKGDLVIHGMDAFAGAIGVSDSDGKSSPVYSACAPIRNSSPEYHSYLLREMSKSNYIFALAKGIRERSTEFRFKEFGNLFVVEPSSEVQAGIANYLDEKTVFIDQIIEKKQRQIELLREKRTAVINHAVTKGLDPEVELVDSGIDWIGMMPKGWEIKKLKHFFKVLDGIRIPLSAEERTYKQGEYPYYGASGIIDHVDNYLFSEDLVLVSEDGANLLCRSTPIAFVAQGKYWVNNHAHILKPHDLEVYFWAERIEQVDMSLYTSGSAQPKLTIDALKNIVVSAPAKLDEKIAISTFVIEENKKFNLAVQKAEKSIALLQEFKSSLISHVVTGKVKI